MHGLGELPRLVEIGRGGFAPEHVGVGRVGEAARDGELDAGPHAEEAIAGAFAGDERLVALGSMSLVRS